jgi:hypothetical protein
MRKYIIASLLLLPILAYTQRYVINPETGKLDYYLNVIPGSDTVINFGSGNTLSSDDYNGIIGYNSSVTAANALSIGRNNTVTEDENIAFGTYLAPSVEQNITIGRGADVSAPMVNSKYGTVGIGYFATVPTLYVHSGYEAGEDYVGDIGGVSIGGADLDTLTALQITSHSTGGSSYFLKMRDSTGVERLTVDDMGNMAISGILTVDSLVSSTTPTIHTAAGDTSNYHTPDKIGDMFIDSVTGDVYISAGTDRGDWILLNALLPIVFVIRRKRFQA